MSKVDLLRELIKGWRSEAETLRRHSADTPATALENAADDLEARLREWRHESLAISEAAEESGYSEEHLRRKIRDGTIPNAGKEGAPRILRTDLPRKPGHRTERSASVEGASGERVGSLTQEMRAVAES